MTRSASLALAVRFALREMRGGLRGFAVFLACIALGVGAIGGVNSLARAITAGIGSQGQTLLGGDIRFELVQREANPKEHAFLQSLGKMAEIVAMRSMARLENGSDQSLVEVKAVDGAYPLYGTLVTEPALGHAQLFSRIDGAWGAAAPALLFERLSVRLGDRIRLGNAVYQLRAKILSEPDLVSAGFGFAPRLMVSLDGLRASGLIQPGSLFEYRYKIRLPADSGPAAIDAVRARALEEFPQAGWSIRSRTNAAPALSSNIERFSQFLTLVGLTALVVGGVGVANAVRSHLESKRAVIATFKCLGASGRFAFAVYLAQIMIIAAIGIAIGLVLAALLPFGASAVLTSVVPLPARAAVYPGALFTAAVFGILVTLLFALLPLGTARDVPAAELFRSQGYGASRWPRRIYLVAALFIGLLLAGLAIALAREREIAAIFVGAVIFSFLVLRAVAVLITYVARHAPAVRSTPLRIAIGNIYRPGALTPSVVLSLGLGLTLLVTIAQIDGNLRRQIAGRLTEQAPDFFFVDIASSRIGEFTSFLENLAPRGKLVRVPMLRGRVVALNGVDVGKLAGHTAGSWVLRGDRGITYSATVPENASLSQGRWWPPGYTGEPLVSFSAEEAGELGLGLGDTVTVNVLGRDVTARIANLRKVEWETLGINFVMVFSPNTFAGAPHAWLATITYPNASAAEDTRILTAVTNRFPAVTTVRVKDALDIVNRLIGQIGTAIRAAASIALISSVLVLSGALAAGNRARVTDAVILKTLGATRRTLISAFGLEYFLIGLATAIFAIAAGGISAWFVVARIMHLQSVFLPQIALLTLLTALILTVGFGLAGTWRILGQKAAPMLREQ